MTNLPDIVRVVFATARTLQQSKRKLLNCSLLGSAWNATHVARAGAVGTL